MERLCVVKRTDTAGKHFAGILMIVLAVVFVIMSVLFGQPYLLILTTVCAIVYVSNFYHAEISFDYTYFGSEMRIARIKGDNRRKLLHEIDLENVRMITKADDPALYNVEKENGVIKKDYTSKTEGAVVYKMVYSSSGKTYVIAIEPSEDFLDALSEKYARIITK